MSKLHRDNAGYVGCSSEETQDPHYSHNRLTLPLNGDINSVLRDEVTFTVTVASVGGSNKYFIDGVQQAALTLVQGTVYTFDQSDSSNLNHPLRFSYTADGTHGGGVENTLGVTKVGSPGSSGAYTRIVVPFGQQNLNYYCGNHPGMGGAANVNSNPAMTTFGLPILKTTDAAGQTLGSGNNFDPYGANLVLAVPMNGSNGGNAFTDQSSAISGSGSSNSSTVQAVNVTTSTAASHYYGSSGYFSTSTSSLSIDDSTAFDFGTGDFTIETWLYQTEQNTNQYYVINAKYGTNVPMTWWWATIGGTMTFYIYDSSSYGYTNANVDVPLNKWTHVAVTREQGTVRLYQDAVEVGSFTFSGAVNNTSHQVTIGEDDAGSYNYVGYMADTRIYKGVAKYRTPLYEAVGLVEVDTSDLSSSNHTITNSGPTFQTDVKKFYDGATEFGTGYLSIPASSDFNFGGGDFTIEMWAYLKAAGSTPTLISSGNYYTVGSNGNWLLRRTNGTQIAFASYDGQGNAEYTELSAVTNLNTWHHIALTRRSNSVQVFVDGTPGESFTVTKSLSDGGTNGLKIGHGNNNAYWNGYIQDVRLYKGIAKYTSSFLPPKRSVMTTARTKGSGIYVVGSPAIGHNNADLTEYPSWYTASSLYTTLADLKANGTKRGQSSFTLDASEFVYLVPGVGGKVGEFAHAAGTMFPYNLSTYVYANLFDGSTTWLYTGGYGHQEAPLQKWQLDATTAGNASENPYSYSKDIPMYVLGSTRVGNPYVPDNTSIWTAGTFFPALINV